MTGGVAHDFNNLLMVVSTAADMLRKRTLDRANERFLNAIQNAAERGTQHHAAIDDVLARTGRTGRNLRRRICGWPASSRLLHSPSPTTSSSNSDISGGSHFVTVDPVQFDLSIINVVVNARDAMPNGGRIVIALKRADIPTKAAARGLRLSVSGQRRRHRAQGPAARVRALLHHQVGRQGHAASGSARSMDSPRRTADSSRSTARPGAARGS